MNGFALFMSGVSTAIIVYGLAMLVLQLAGQRGPIRRTGVIESHTAGQGEHEHWFSPWLPGLLRKMVFERAARRCIYTKLNESPAEVWENEVEHITIELFKRLPYSSLRYAAAEAELIVRYTGLTFDQSKHAKNLRVAEIAAARLARRGQDAR